MELRRRIAIAALLLLVVTSTSVLGYRLLGHDVGLLQALYMAVITLAGVGYGEFVDTSHNPLLRVFNMFVVLFGVMITAYVFSSVTAFLVESDYSNVFRRRRMLKRISQMKGHYIVCGSGDTGRHAVTELQKTGTPFVVIELHEDNVRRLIEHDRTMFEDLLYIVGDATDEDVLEQAGISRAAGVLTTLPQDKENLVVTVMVRQNNPDVRIVARCTDLKFKERILKAGANSVVSPNMIGGLRLASEVLRPHVVGFLDLMLREQSRTLRVEEIVVAENSPWHNKSLGSLNLRSQYNLLTMAVKGANADAAQNFWVNPPDAVSLNSGVIIIVMGDVKDIHRARHDASHSATVFTSKA